MSTIKVDTIKNTSNVEVYTAKAWVNFDGTQTAANMIRSSGNVSSITDNGTGDYTVNFTTAMTDVNYAVAGAVSTVYDSGVTPRSTIPEPTLLNTGSVRISCTYHENTRLDSKVVCISVFR